MSSSFAGDITTPSFVITFPFAVTRSASSETAAGKILTPSLFSEDPNERLSTSGVFSPDDILKRTVGESFGLCQYQWKIVTAG